MSSLLSAASCGGVVEREGLVSSPWDPGTGLTAIVQSYSHPLQARSEEEAALDQAASNLAVTD